MNALEKSELITQAAQMYMKGMSYSKIGQKMGVSSQQAKQYVETWNDYVKDKAANDPDLLDRFLENVLSYKEKLNVITEEAWNIAELADEHGAMSTKIQALRLAKDLAEMEARAMQLMSNRMESGYIERMKRVERVNGILSSIIKEVISDCDKCSTEAYRRLEEMYRIMPETEYVDAETVGDDGGTPDDSDVPALPG
jgi:uncharacterized protein YjcR